MHDLDLSLSDMSKIEGKASCNISVREGKIINLKFAIAEYKRFYTQAIRGKDVIALPQHTARICGTCSNAHLLCALKAVEDALEVKISLQTDMLRKLLNYALIIRDHALHLYVFVLPDLFNKDSLLDFDENNPVEHKFLDDAFFVKSTGNNLSKVVGGRSVHAPFLTIGGFTKLPDKGQLEKCAKNLFEARTKISDLIGLFAEKDKSLTMDKLIYSSVVDDEMSYINGVIKQSNGSIFSAKEYESKLRKVKFDHSQAAAYNFDDQPLFLGALARLNINKDKLHSETKKNISKYLDKFPSNNIFHNNLAQAIEVLHAIDSSLDLLKKLENNEEKPIPYKRKKGVGYAAIEAPRGTLFYKIEIDDNGIVTNGQIIVPTGINQIVIEASIKKYIETDISKINNKAEIEFMVERIVRAFDPCMSCATHFLKFRWKRL